ncbi:ABC transporter permease [Candidatus Bipolaricaulota bacterium]|nr:ABC transporter permease [Candidatus Bipolaricaulota bacterium]
MTAVFWKELADHLGSRRFVIFFFLILIVGGASAYLAAQALSGRETASEFIYLNLFTVSGGGLPSFLGFLAFFGPLIGVVLGFDAVNSEFNRGTASRVLSQPIYRDWWINGKFLAGFTALAIAVASIILIIVGLGLYIFGFPPNGVEISRIAMFFVISVIYLGFWLSLGILFSIVFRQTATSALASIALWLFFTLFLYMLAGLIADQVAPIKPGVSADVFAKHESIRDLVLRFSPVALYEEATTAILIPSYRGLGIAALLQEAAVPTSPLPLGQSLLIVWPQLVSLVALTSVCFAISYVIFMRREIRST